MLKVLFLDIETAPKKGWLWRVWKENINPRQLIDDWFMLSWAAEWQSDPSTRISKLLRVDDVLKKDDRPILRDLWNLLDEADVVVGHNMAGFDIPSINTRFIKAGMPPPSPFQIVDTLSVAKKQFKLTYNGLDYVAKFLGVGSKTAHAGFELWERCVHGDQAALNEMLAYNENDVVILRKVYNILLPYIKSHPSHGVVNPTDKPVCTRCGSQHIHKRGYYHTKISTYQRYYCTDCGGWSRSRKNSRSKEQMSQTLMPI